MIENRDFFTQKFKEFFIYIFNFFQKVFNLEYNEEFIFQNKNDNKIFIDIIILLILFLII